MKKISRKIIVAGLAAVIGIGGLSGTVLAAGTYQPVSLNSYGVFSYDDGNANNNNGYKYDIFLDASDLTKLNDNLNVLKVASDALNTQVTNLNTDVKSLRTEITNITGQTQDISALKNDVNNLKSSVSTLQGNYSRLNSSVNQLTTDVASCFQSVSNGKALLASTLTDLGVETASDATFEEINDNIKKLSTMSFSGTIEYIRHYHDSTCGSGKCGGTQNYYTHWTDSNGSITAQYKCAKCGNIATYNNVSSTPSTYSGKCVQGGSYSCGYSNGEIIGATITY